MTSYTQEFVLIEKSTGKKVAFFETRVQARNQRDFEIAKDDAKKWAKRFGSTLTHTLKKGAAFLD